MKVFATILLLCLSLCVGAQNVFKATQQAKSDSLFAAGVELYKAGNYKAAIPLFSASNKIDKAVLDSTSNRRDYSSMWLGSCYYKLGDTIKAKECSLDYYRFEPIDRRLTIKSDSLSAIGSNYYQQKDYKQALSYFQQCGEIEKKVVGEKHVWYGNTLKGCGSCSELLNDSTNALKYYLHSLAIDSCSYGKYSEKYISVTLNMANLYYNYKLANHFEQAISYCMNAYSTANFLENYNEKKIIAYYIAQCYNYLGLAKSGNEQRSLYDKALQYLSFADSTDTNITNFRKTVQLNIAVSYSNDAYKKNKQGNFKEAIQLETVDLKMIEKIFGKEHPDYATALSDLALYNSEAGNYQEAVRLETVALKIRERAFGKEHPRYAAALSDLALYTSNIGNYQEAVRLETEALKIREKTSGKVDPSYATALSDLALYTSDMGNDHEAICLETEALKIREKAFGKEHLDYATSLDKLACYNANLGNYQRAIELAKEALKIIEKVQGKEHVDYATTLIYLALSNSGLGDYQEAIRLATEALNIEEKVLGKEHPYYARALSNLAGYNLRLENYQEAIRLAAEALRIREKVLGKEHPEYAATLGTLAQIYLQLGNYQEAIHLESEALKIREKVLGKEHPDYAKSLNNLADYYSNTGYYQKAIHLGSEALKIREKALGKDHPDYAISLNNLALYNAYIGNYKESIRLETEALTTFEKLYGKEHHYYTTSLSNLAEYNFNLRNYQEAIQLGTEALKIKKIILGEKHSEYATSLNNIAEYNFALGNYKEAIRMGFEASILFEKLYGKEHPYYAISIDNLVGHYFKNKDYKEAEILLSKYMNIASHLIKTNFNWLTQNERTLYWDKYKNSYLCKIPRYDYTVQSDTAYTKMDYNAQLLSKGLLLNSEIEFRNLIQKQESNKTLIAKYEEWRSMKVQINKLYEKTDSSSVAYRKSREERADSLERILLRDSKAFGDYNRNLSIQWQDVQARLGIKDMAIEYTTFPVGKDSTMYCALLLKKNSTSPVLVPLFEKKELDNLYIDPTHRFSETLTFDTEENHKRIYKCKELGQLVWGKILPYLNDVQQVYFSPSGVFHQLGIENLTLEDGKTFSDHYAAYRLSSTRELATTNQTSSSGKVDLYGGLQYNEEPQTMTDMSHKNRRDLELSDNLTLAFGDSLSLYERAKACYGAVTDSSQTVRAAFEVKELPYTKEEVTEINTELSKATAKKPLNTALYTGTAGNEESFKALSGTHPKIIHIATHGFFLPQSKAEEYNDKRSFLMGFKEQEQKTIVDHSLSRSGLLMAGARKAWMGEAIPDSVDDGILTAREIAHMDLNGTDLVILSACETGLGDVTGEGVFGLQRGFKKAGVNTLVMSLWKVDDKATKMMMTQFYGNLMKGQTKRAAFLNAQKYLKDYVIQEKQEARITSDMSPGEREYLQNQQGKIEITHPYASPQFWAAFIMLDGIK